MGNLSIHDVDEMCKMRAVDCKMENMCIKENIFVR